MVQDAERERELALAVDLGGTRFRVGLVHAGGRVVYRSSHATQAEEGPDRVIERVVAALREAQTHLHAGQFARGVGVAAPGPLDPGSGVVFSAPNMPGWKDVPLKALLEQALGLHAVVGNDANLAALGEARFGAGRGHAHLVYLTISTGVGSGILVDGKLLVGSQGLAGEAGHTTIALDGPACKCGNRGCLETLASGTAIANRARELLAQGRPSLLSAQQSRLTAQTVGAAAQQGDPLAREVLLGAARALGAGIVNLVHLFNPTLVILGGGVTQAGDLWWEAVRGTVDQCAMPAFRRNLRVVAAVLGDDMGLLGAGAAVWNEPAVSGAA
ncbi:MAG: ROK family protein [Chloroflexi bacterium]|nr:ROK family protein [Chloroflexota bacterium]